MPAAAPISSWRARSSPPAPRASSTAAGALGDRHDQHARGQAGARGRICLRDARHGHRLRLLARRRWRGRRRRRRQVLSKNVDKAHRLMSAWRAPSRASTHPAHRLRPRARRRHDHAPRGPRPGPPGEARRGRRACAVGCGRASASPSRHDRRRSRRASGCPGLHRVGRIAGCGVLTCRPTGLRGPGGTTATGGGHLMPRSRRLEGHAPVRRAVTGRPSSAPRRAAEVRVPPLADGQRQSSARARAASFVPAWASWLSSVGASSAHAYSRCAPAGHTSPARARTPLPCVDPQRDGATRSVPPGPPFRGSMARQACGVMPL